MMRPALLAAAVVATLLAGTGTAFAQAVAVEDRLAALLCGAACAARFVPL